MNQRGASEISSDPQRPIGAVLALVVEEHPETALRVEQRLELLDRPAHARTHRTGSHRGRDAIPIEIVNVDDGWDGRRRRCGRFRLGGSRLFGLRRDHRLAQARDRTAPR